jgi:hypothetical protein
MHRAVTQRSWSSCARRMAVIKQEATAEVDRKWGSPFRSQQLFDLKVQARLAGNEEYRSLQDRVQAAEATLAAE